jgi:hypothetical protein
MANSIINTTSITSLPKHVAHALSELNKGGEITLIRGATGKAEIYNLKSTPVNTKAIKTLQAMFKQKNLNLINYRDGLKNIKIDVKESTDYNFHAGNIMKSGERIEFGYLAEAFVQAAMVAKFTSKRDSAVTPADIVKYLKDYLNKPSNQTVAGYIVDKPPAKSLTVNKAYEYIGKNKNPKIEDHIFVYYSLNDKAFNWLKSKLSGATIPPVLQPYFNDAAQFVNSGNVQKHAEYFFTNGRKDRIDIVMLGVIGQGETKADIGTVYYEGYKGTPGTGTKVKFNLSLSVKINHIAQVGQITGINSKVFGELTKIFGVELNNADKEKIDNLASKLKPKINDAKIQGHIYEIVFKQLEKAKLPGVIQGITHFIAFNAAAAKTLSVVDIGSGLKTYFLKNLQDIGKSLQGKSITSKVQTGGGSGTTKQIQYLINDAVLLSVNSRYAGGHYRNMISTGPILRTFLSKA